MITSWYHASSLVVNVVVECIIIMLLYIVTIYISIICLQSQLASSSSSLAATREEVKRLELQLKSAQQTSEATITGMGKQHASVVKALETKVQCNSTVHYIVITASYSGFSPSFVVSIKLQQKLKSLESSNRINCMFHLQIANLEKELEMLKSQHQSEIGKHAVFIIV